MNEGTRYGTTVHPRKGVQDSDAYLGRACKTRTLTSQIMDGKIKRVAPLPSLCS